MTEAIIAAAIEGFEAQKLQIDSQIAELRGMLHGRNSGSSSTTAEPKRHRRKMSAAGRKRIAEAQRKRWAALKSTKAPASSKASKPKRKLSAAGRRAII